MAKAHFSRQMTFGQSFVLRPLQSLQEMIPDFPNFFSARSFNKCYNTERCSILRHNRTSMTNKRNPSVQSVERAIDIMETFSAEEPGLGVGELSRRVKLPKSTVFRLLTTLESRGFIAQNSETGLYHLGVELIPLANSVFFYSDLRRIARPYLRKLANTLEETAGLFALVDKEVVHLDQVEYKGRLVMRAGGEGRPAGWLDEQGL